MPTYIKDPSQSDGAVRHPILDTLRRATKSSGAAEPDAIMQVGAQPIISKTSSALGREMLKRAMDIEDDSFMTDVWRAFKGNRNAYVGGTIKDFIGQQFPSTKPYLDHPKDSLMKLFKGE